MLLLSSIELDEKLPSLAAATRADIAERNRRNVGCDRRFGKIDEVVVAVVKREQKRKGMFLLLLILKLPDHS